MKDALFEKGLRLRKQVLGAEYVDRQVKGTDEFMLPMQVLATQTAWGLVWSRPGLTKKTRSLITLAFVLARGKSEELAVHLRGALRNGVTRGEIREVLMHSAVYCGFPEALGGFRVAREVLKREGAAAGPARKPAAKRRARRR